MLKFYARLFLGFWLITITIVVSIGITNRYFDQPNIAKVVERDEMRRLIPQIVNRLNRAAEVANPRRLVMMVTRERERQNDVELYLINPREEEITGYATTEAVLKVARQARPGAEVLRRQIDDKLYLTRYIPTRIGDDIRVVASLPAPPPRWLMLFNEFMWLRLAIAVLVSGVLCFWMAQRFGRPIQALRDASRELASGKMDSRIPVAETGGDEITDTARDFNAMADRLQTLMDNQQRLIRDVSHELRSPLARIQVALALAQQRAEQNGQEPNLAPELQRIETECDRLNKLIGSLLLLPREEIKRDDTVDLLALLQSLGSDCEFEHRDRGVKVDIEARGADFVLRANAEYLHQAFENLLRNGSRYTADNSAIEVDLSRADAQISVRIRDHGPGVDPQHLENLFKPFYRVSDARETSTGGHGVGLAISERVIRLHGGSISLSNAQGENGQRLGLVVSITLPVS